MINASGARTSLAVKTFLCLGLITGLVLGVSLGVAAVEEKVKRLAETGTWTVAWPPVGDQRLVAVLSLDGEDGTLTLAVHRDGVEVLEPSALGIVTSDSDFSTELRFISRSDRVVTEEYAIPTGKRRERYAEMAEATFSFESAEARRVDVVIRVSDDGVAYRYILPDETTVLREASSFQIPTTAMAFLAPYTVNYEGIYATTTAARVATGTYAYPALFQVGDTFILLTESDVDGRYTGSRLFHQAGTGRYDLVLTDDQIHTSGRFETPWRVAIIGDLATVTESTFTDDIAPASKISDTSWIRPGRVAWSWIADNASPKSYQIQKEFVDYAAARGWEYVLVDAGWDSNWVPELVEYAKPLGVDILLWVHWTEVQTSAQAKALLDQVRAWGVKGLKIDFMDSDAQERQRWYDMILVETAERELLVNFHGSKIPHGIQRTWPHVMTMEAVYGGEYAQWSGIPATHVVTLPFTRNVIGSMDYTPMAFRQGLSDAAELALSVLYESGLQHYAGSLDAYRKRPELERFLEQVPAVWDETRLLGGYPGLSVMMARRSEHRWFIGGVVAAALPPQKVPLDFLQGPWLVEVVRDGKHGLVREQHIVEGPDDQLTLDIPPSGGFAAIACPWEPGVETCYEPVDRVPLSSLTVDLDETVTKPGASVKLTADFALRDSGQITEVTLKPIVPEGWSVEGDSARTPEMTNDETLAAEWRVTVPAEVEAGSATLLVAAEYRIPSLGREQPAIRRIEQPIHLLVQPEGVHFVSDLPFLASSNGWGPVERDMTNGETDAGDGEPLKLRGTTYVKGLGVHAPSVVVLDLAGDYERFVAHVGVDDSRASEGSVIFEVIGDGQVLAQTGVLTTKDPVYVIDVDVTGIDKLTLVVNDGGDGATHDHANWADAQLRLSTVR